jgi:hypothetical protein
MSVVGFLGAASYAYRGVFASAAAHVFFAVSCLGWVLIMPTIDKPPTGWFLRLIGLKADRQPMATAKSGGWEPPRNWNHRPDGMKRPEPPPRPPNRVDRVRVFIAQPKPEERNALGFWDLPRAWPDAEDAEGAGLAWARQGAIQEKKDLDRRAKSLSDFIGLSEAFERLDPVEQDLLRHQCEHMWSYSEVLGARIANWRDGGGN